jgi:hypothetical protein
MKPTPPPPFLPHTEAWAAYGFDKPHIQAEVGETDDERLRQLMLYAQAKSRGQGWTIEGTYCSRGDPNGRFHLVNLEVEYDARHRNAHTLMHVEYVVATNEQGHTTSRTGSEGPGFYWLDLPSVTAFCPTMADALYAINAIAPYIPEFLRYHVASLERSIMQQYVLRCIRLTTGNGGGDPILTAALQCRLLDLHGDAVQP